VQPTEQAESPSTYDLTSIPFVLFHVATVVGIAIVGFSWSMLALCIGLYYLRMFGITAGYHRYFSHRGYKTSRAFQFVLALLGTISLQKGVLWWAAHHRDHHKYSDTERDIHSPRQSGFWYSHMGWILARETEATKLDRIKDFARYPELVWLNRWWVVPPVALAVLLFVLGGGSALVWGFFVSSTLLWHGTFTINSLAHVFGSRRYKTTDDSKNNFWLALITMGEGWHNNHHYYQSTARNGFFWWEIDLSYMILKVFSWVGLVWDLRQPPEWVLRNETSNRPMELSVKVEQRRAA
jgi:stearoyl-CoA desaturase (Delta-9 desaturase)